MGRTLTILHQACDVPAPQLTQVHRFGLIRGPAFGVSLGLPRHASPARLSSDFGAVVAPESLMPNRSLAGYFEYPWSQCAPHCFFVPTIVKVHDMCVKAVDCIVEYPGIDSLFAEQEKR